MVILSTKYQEEIRNELELIKMIKYNNIIKYGFLDNMILNRSNINFEDFISKFNKEMNNKVALNLW